MSDTDREVLALLDRAAADAPPLHLDRGDVVARGEQIVRRRRTASLGMGLAGLVLAGGLWTGLGGAGMLGTTQIAPAGTDWEVPSGVVLTPTDVGVELPHVVLTRDGTADLGTVTIGEGASAEVVAGELVAGGLVRYEGEDVTVAVWPVPRGGEGRVISEGAPDDPGSSAWLDGSSVEVDGGRVDFAFVPRGVVVTDAVVEIDRLGGKAVQMASGLPADLVAIEQDGFEQQVFVVPSTGAWGLLTRASYSTTGDNLGVETTLDRPWWRGGGLHGAQLALLPAGAVEARATVSDLGGRLITVLPGVTERVGDRGLAMALYRAPILDSRSDTESGLTLDLEWADTAGVWHRQDHDASPSGWVPREVVAGDDAGPGEEVTLLGKDYTVAVDPLGYPQLIDPEDGSVLLSVTDADGPSSGGLVDMTRWRWPWQPEEWIHFDVGGEGGTGASPQDVVEQVTIVGPQGKVALTSFVE